MRPVNSRLLARHTGRVATHMLFSIWMINAAALLLNQSMARIHCWSNAHGWNKYFVWDIGSQLLIISRL